MNADTNNTLKPLCITSDQQKKSTKTIATIPNRQRRINSIEKTKSESKYSLFVFFH